MDQVSPANLTEIPALAQKKLQPDMVERFQASGKMVLGLFDTPRDAPNFPVLARDKNDDSVGIGERILANDNGFAFMSGHR
jgi:hypothetical protein